MLIYRDNKKTCMKKLLVVLAVLFIGILLAGCTTQPATPTPTPTPTPVPTTVATPVPTTVEPTKVVVVVVKNETATPTPTPTPVPTYIITFTKDLTVQPGINAYIKAGTMVMWVNNDPYKPHGVHTSSTLTSDVMGYAPINIPYGSSFNVTFTKAGAYDYHTEFQPETQGTIYVS
jgi:plastocyanin